MAYKTISQLTLLTTACTNSVLPIEQAGVRNGCHTLRLRNKIKQTKYEYLNFKKKY